MNYLAHSARPDLGIPAQDYCNHITNVVRSAVLNADRAAVHCAIYAEVLRAAVKLAAEFHDLGKLDDKNQEVLRTNCGKMLNHVDAGVALLLKKSTSRANLLAALTVFSHHRGLPDWPHHCTRKVGPLRDLEPTPDGKTLQELTDFRLDEYRERHFRSVGCAAPPIACATSFAKSPLLWRMALSCLVDADHADTARNYGDTVVDQDPPPLDYGLRLALLDQYVAELARGRNDERSRLRSQIYGQCRIADCSQSLLACDSPVGSGKTTAVMAHLLKAAEAKKLRRIFVVLPFTNIIDQSVRTYRKALVANGESAQAVVAAHHHKAEFDEPPGPRYSAARLYSVLWHAPIVVTTAVQFFETLAARMPAALRKLHQLPGSAIFIDEAHTALPSHLWPQAWLWLRELEKHWNCHIVLGSGSLNRFWELPDFVDPPVKLPQLVSESARSSSSVFESQRVTYRTLETVLDLEAIGELVQVSPGPRLLIVNTVQSAAAIARYLSEILGGDRVEHLSTSLTPKDRDYALKRVKRRLKHDKPNWILVATSCVEAGVDISFRTGFRERCSLTSLLQIAGRINRSNEFENSEVWDFQLRHGHLLRQHPAFETSARILGELFNENKISPQFCTEALRREITQGGMPKKKNDILIAERNADLPALEELFRVISSNTLTAIADPELIRTLESGGKVSPEEILTGSIQIWQGRAEGWGIAEFEYIPGLMKWTLPYDNFIGYMAGVLPLIDAGQFASII